MWQHVHKSTLLAVQKGLREVNYHSLKQLFGHFLHRHYVLKVDIRTAAASHTTEIVEDIWFHAKYPSSIANIQSESLNNYLSVDGFEEEPEMSDTDSAGQQSKVFRNSQGTF